MSETPPPPAHDHRAQAAADKAYAKAQRPWYKKKRFIIPLALVVLIILGSALGSSGDDDKGTQDAGGNTTKSQLGSQPEPSTPATSAAEAPAENTDNSSKGQGAITWGNWEVVGKIQVAKDALDDYEVKLRVKNVSDETDTGIFTVNMLKGTEILGQADCTTPDIDPGGIGTANCFSTDKFKPGWTEITIEDSF